MYSQIFGLAKSRALVGLSVCHTAKIPGKWINSMPLMLRFFEQSFVHSVNSVAICEMLSNIIDVKTEEVDSLNFFFVVESFIYEITSFYIQVRV